MGEATQLSLPVARHGPLIENHGGWGDGGRWGGPGGDTHSSHPLPTLDASELQLMVSPAASGT